MANSILLLEDTAVSFTKGDYWVGRNIIGSIRGVSQLASGEAEIYRDFVTISGQESVYMAGSHTQVDDIIIF